MFRIWAQNYFDSAILLHYKSSITSKTFFIESAPDPDEPDDPSKIVYNSSSPDEEALIKGAAHFGYVFVDR